MTKRARLFVANTPITLRVDPELATEIGLNESVVLMQLEYLIAVCANERDGKLWTYQSVRDLQSRCFPFWSLMTINRAINSLVERSLLLVENYNSYKFDRTRWFALNPEGINKLRSVKMVDYDPSSVTRADQDDTASYQDDTRASQIDTPIPQITTESSTQKKRETPLAVLQELGGFRPAPGGELEGRLTEVSDLGKWRSVVERWIACGYWRGNIGGMLDWYAHGIPTKGRPARVEAWMRSVEAAVELGEAIAKGQKLRDEAVPVDDPTRKKAIMDELRLVLPVGVCNRIGGMEFRKPEAGLLVVCPSEDMRVWLERFRKLITDAVRVVFSEATEIEYVVESSSG